MFQEIFHFKKFSENLFTAGMPTKEQIEDSKNYIELIINLAPHNSHDALPNEENYVKSLGLEYINIPVDWNSPTEDNLEKFMNLMDTFEDKKKILVHCEANFRASSFVTMYRVLRKGWKESEALEKMHEIWNEEAYPIWDEFIADILIDFKKEKEK